MFAVDSIKTQLQTSLWSHLLRPSCTSCPCSETALILTGDWHNSRSGRKPLDTLGVQWTPLFGFSVTFTFLMSNRSCQAWLEMKQSGRHLARIPESSCRPGKSCFQLQSDRIVAPQPWFLPCAWLQLACTCTLFSAAVAKLAVNPANSSKAVKPPFKERHLKAELHCKGREGSWKS